MFCRKCGNKLNDDVKFCPKCGTKVDMRQDDVDIQQNKNFFAWSNVRKKRVLTSMMLVVLLAGSIMGIKASRTHLGSGAHYENQNDDKNTITGSEGKNKIFTLKPEMVKRDKKTGISYVSNIIIVYCNEEPTDEELRKLEEISDGTIVGSIPSIYQYQIEVPSQSYEAQKTKCELIESEEFVRIAYPELAAEIEENTIPNDPWGMFGDDWSEDDPSGNNWWIEAINAPSAWNYNNQINPVNIGIVDNGFDVNHEDLKGVIKHVSKYNDSNIHGTHVAGIIGANANNKIGITGVVWNAQIYTHDYELTPEQNEEYEKKVGEKWAAYSEIFSGIEELVVDYGCKVVNLSLGDKLRKENFTDDKVQATGEAVSAFMAGLLNNNDFIIVESAGNGYGIFSRPIDAKYNGLFCSVLKSNCVESENVSADDILNRIIIVGATKNKKKNNYTTSRFSNYGENVDIWAPGTEIYSALPEGEYASKDGTSMAAPMVSGVVALAWGANPALSGPEVKAILCDKKNQKKVNVPNNKHYPKDWYGMVNAQLAVEDALGKIKEPEVLVKSEESEDATVVEAPSYAPKDVDLKKIWGDIEVDEYVIPGYEVHFYLPKTVKVAHMSPPKFGPGEGEYSVYITGEGMQNEYLMCTGADTKETAVIGDAWYLLRKFQEVGNMEYFLEFPDEDEYVGSNPAIFDFCEKYSQKILDSAWVAVDAPKPYYTLSVGSDDGELVDEYGTFTDDLKYVYHGIPSVVTRRKDGKATYVVGVHIAPGRYKIRAAFGYGSIEIFSEAGESKFKKKDIDGPDDSYKEEVDLKEGDRILLDADPEEALAITFNNKY